MGLFRFSQGVILLSTGFVALNFAAFVGGVGAWRAFHPVSMSAKPTLVRKSHNLVSGARFSCVIASSGRPLCWGAGATQVPADLPPAQAIAAGDDFACGVDDESRVRCWGNSPAPTPVLPLRATVVDARAANLCVVTDKQTVECWGNVASPRLPTAVFDVVVGESQACALDVEGLIWCWGGSENPTRLDARFVKIFAGRTQACGADQHGLLRCRGARENAVLPEQQGVLDMAIGARHACVASGEWLVSCWGDHALQQTSVPEGLGRVEALAAGDNHTCALVPGGKVRCWGDNAHGELDVPGEVAVRGE